MDIPIILTGTLAGSALLLPALDIAIGTKTNRTFSSYFTSFVMAISLALVLLSATSVIPLSESAAPKLLQNDFMGLVFAIIVLSVALMVSLSSIDYMRDEPNTSIYYSLLLFTSLGMILLSFAADLSACLASRRMARDSRSSTRPGASIGADLLARLVMVKVHPLPPCAEPIPTKLTSWTYPSSESGSGPVSWRSSS